MLFEIVIKDPKGKPFLRDVFHMESLTALMDISTALLEPLDEQKTGRAYALAIRSEKSVHVRSKLKTLEEVSLYKNALYDELIKKSTATTL